MVKPFVEQPYGYHITIGYHLMIKQRRYDDNQWLYDGQIIMPWIMINDLLLHWYLSWDETVQERCDLMDLISQPVAKNEVNPFPVAATPLRSDMSFVLEI